MLTSLIRDCSSSGVIKSGINTKSLLSPATWSEQSTRCAGNPHGATASLGDVVKGFRKDKGWKHFCLDSDVLHAIEEITMLEIISTIY